MRNNVTTKSNVYNRILYVEYVGRSHVRTYVFSSSYVLQITLCWSHGKQYDLVYTKTRLEALTVSQAIVYDVLYKDVFELGGEEVDFAVTKMLYDKEHFKNKRHLTFSQWCNSVGIPGTVARFSLLSFPCRFPRKKKRKTRT